MNYQHIYRAASFSDVFKHIILITLAKSFFQKSSGFCYLDTHSGPGYYDLFSEAASKNKEHEQGLFRLLHVDNRPPAVQSYLDCIRHINDRLGHASGSSIQYYPGSPMIMRSLLRPSDRMVLCELHPNAFEDLKSRFAKDRHASVHLMDGHQALKVFLPPKEKRGLILIDPPYEKPHEFTSIIESLVPALKRFPTGAYAIWYPIKNRSSINLFHRSLKQITQRPLLICELTLFPDAGTLFLNGCGMAFINPPWQLDKHIESFLPWLWKTLGQHGQGEHRVFAL